MSVEGARRDYGVVIEEVPDRIDEAAGRRARRELLRLERIEVLTLPLRQVRRKTEREEISASF